MNGLKKPFTNRWGNLRQVQLPSSIVQNKTFTLEPAAIKTLIVLFHVQKVMRRFQGADEIRAVVKVGQKRLTERTGYSPRTIIRAVESLRESGYIATMPDRKGKKKNGSSVMRYILLRPDTREPLVRNAPGSILLANKLAYFTLPSCIVTKSEQLWSLAKVTPSETTLYLAVLYLANDARRNDFKTTDQELRKLCGLSKATYDNAMSGLEGRGLIRALGQQNELSMTICDPFTGEPLHTPDGTDENDPANYHAKNDRGVWNRVALNTGSPKQVEDLIHSCLPEQTQVIRQTNGDLTIQCPFHDDSTPSLSVSPSKRCFRCFGCGEAGTVTTLIATLKNVTRAEGIQHVATFMGKIPEFRQPDKNATAIYSYRNEKGKLLKQVLRYPNDAEGNKVIRQRQPKGSGYVWDTKGLPPMLLNREMLQLVSKVFLTEGEKDATTVIDLWKEGKLDGIGTTSGGAESWDASLAKLLRGKLVTVLPDSDEPGARYAEAVTSSLEAEGIEYRVIKFDDVGAKDVTEFLHTYSVEELVQRVIIAWDGQLDFFSVSYGDDLADEVVPI